LLQNMPGVQSVSVSAQSISISLPRGSARLDEINRYCFDNGMVLTHLMLKRKRLEEKFFELTHT